MSNRTLKLVSLTAIGLLAAGAAAAAPSAVSVSIPSPVPPPPAFGIIYDQIAPVSALGRAIASQNFETAFDAFDAEAADDFTVPLGNFWDIQRVVVDGVFTMGGGPANSVDIVVYTDAGGAPSGTAACTYLAQTPVNGLLDPDWAVDLSPTCNLANGTYWLSVVSNQDSAQLQWFWHKIDQTIPQIGNVAHWRNPNNGFGTGCTTFTPMNTCGTIEVNTDLAFRLEGTTLADTDLSITKTIDNPSPIPGDTVVFTIDVTNFGPAAATGVTVSDTLPAAVTYVSDDCGGVNTPPWTWAIGAMAPAATATCNITATVNAVAGASTNTATVTGNETDPDPSNNTDSVIFTVGIDADLSIIKTMDNEMPVPGDTVVFTIEVTNNGPANATSVVVTDTLPAVVTYVSDDCGGADIPPWTWIIGPLAASATVTCNITADIAPDASGAHSNTAEVTSRENDPNPVDNTSTVVFIISLLAIPTLGKAGIAALLLLLAAAGVLLLRRLT